MGCGIQAKGGRWLSDSMKGWDKFNKTLLTKWRWRLMHISPSMWCRILRANYRSLACEVEGISSNSSKWWTNLYNPCFTKPPDSPDSWFDHCCVKKIGEGNMAQCWNKNWLGMGILRDRYWWLFNLSAQQYCCVKDLGSCINGLCRWEFQWKLDLQEREATLLKNLQQNLKGAVCEKGRWTGQSAYAHL